MRRTSALALILVSLCARADVISPAPDSVRVTLYGSSGGVVMVSETRTIDLPAGTSRIVYLGVADAIVPQTAGIDGLPATVLESNFDYDLLTPGALIAKSHGERVRLVRTDDATGRTTEREAILRSGPQGVVLEIDGKIETLGCSGLDEKLVFPRVPAGLADEPRLSMTVSATTPGRHTVQLNYLALGMDWSADYIARIDPNGQTLNLSGWITLVNHSSTTFANTPAEVVAGQLARDEQETQPPGPTDLMESASCWPIGQFATMLEQRMFKRAVGDSSARNTAALGVSSALAPIAPVTGLRRYEAQMRELGDYKLYAVPQPTTIAARQSKQVSFLSQSRVPFTRVYSFHFNEGSMMRENDFEPRPAKALLRLQNKESDGLGKPLPAGVISVLEPGGASRVLAGQDRIIDTPVGLPIELTLGQAMDVRIDARVTEERRIAVDDHHEMRMSVEARLSNDKPKPVTLEYRQPRMGAGSRVVSESHSHTLKDGDIRWTFRLRPGERAVLRYSMQRPD